MALFNWFNTKEHSAKSTQAAHTDMRSTGLSLEQVLSAHIAWHERFLQVMHGAKDADFELTKVYQDNYSFLGKWLCDEAKMLFGHLPEYDAVCKAHATFHGCAGVVLGQHQMGNEAYAQQFLKTKYRSAFNNVKIEITTLYSVASFKHSIRHQSTSLAA